jgi:hypothetical protein
MIRKKMEGIGLSDILLEAGLIGSGSVTGVMTGKPGNASFELGIGINI